MMPLPLWWFAADPVTVSVFPWTDLLGATALAMLAVGLVIAEIFVFSMGILALAAAGCAIAAIMMAFDVSPTVGWSFLVAVPVIIAVVIRWGLTHLSASTLVPKATLTTDAGYHHVTDALGIVAGATGVLVTAAVPSGRARFAGGEVDVTLQGASGSPGAQVRVLRIEGPLVVAVVV